MAKADLLIKLVNAVNRGDDNLYKKVVESIIADERKKQHHVLADQLKERLSQYKKPPEHKNGGSIPFQPPSSNTNIESFLMHVQPQARLQDLVLDSVTLKTLHEFIHEHHRSDVLKSYNLEPRHSLLTIGAPGNGKTTLAEAIAGELMIPFYVVRYDGIIGSYLGETAARLRKLFDFIKSQECVVFFDEFDSIGKERGDKHETGEIKRVVSSLLFQIDNLPSYVIVIGATNHPELLDRAVWRRFQVRVKLDPPAPSDIAVYIDRFQRKTNFSFEYAPKTIALRLKGLSFAEVEEFCLDVQRRYVLRLPDADIKNIIQECYGEVDSRKI